MQINELKEKIGGRFFTVFFKKKDGSIRKMNGRLGVTKHVTGGGYTKPNNIITVYEVNKKQYRSFDIDRLIYLKCGKLEVLREDVEHATV